MYVYTYIYMYTYIYIYVYICIHIYIYMYMYLLSAILELALRPCVQFHGLGSFCNDFVMTILSVVA